MFEWPRHPPCRSRDDRDWRERQIFEWIFARKLVKVGFVIACPMPTVMRPTWVFADRAASEASGETVLNQNESTRVDTTSSSARLRKHAGSGGDRATRLVRHPPHARRRNRNRNGRGRGRERGHGHGTRGTHHPHRSTCLLHHHGRSALRASPSTRLHQRRVRIQRIQRIRG